MFRRGGLGVLGFGALGLRLFWSLGLWGLWVTRPVGWPPGSPSSPKPSRDIAFRVWGMRVLFTDAVMQPPCVAPAMSTGKNTFELHLLRCQCSDSCSTLAEQAWNLARSRFTVAEPYFQAAGAAV